MGWRSDAVAAAFVLAVLSGVRQPLPHGASANGAPARDEHAAPERVLDAPPRVREPGIFVRVPGARFDQVATTWLKRSRVAEATTVVLAHDAQDDRIHAWTTRGFRSTTRCCPQAREASSPLGAKRTSR
jgi:hypothetical protein